MAQASVSAPRFGGLPLWWISRAKPPNIWGHFLGYRGPGFGPL